MCFNGGMTSPHELEEQEFGRGSRLWDADPDVCCAAFQLGACSHTEAAAYQYEDDDPADHVAIAVADPGVPAEDEPF